MQQTQRKHFSWIFVGKFKKQSILNNLTLLVKLSTILDKDGRMFFFKKKQNNEHLNQVVIEY